uniref:Uncharacterized protein n=1 Tax=Rousettus aegyptiacus TaxID=9407 RepID=A0A7J8JHV3_ROUAE|nr:hypothetical protein HJG63_010331 [Rousettus aegyptiacus]
MAPLKTLFLLLLLCHVCGTSLPTSSSPCTYCMQRYRIGSNIATGFISVTGLPEGCALNATLCTHWGFQYWMGYIKVKSESGQSCQEPENLGETWACWRWTSSGRKIHNHAEGPAVREIVQWLHSPTTPKPTPSPRPQSPQMYDQLKAALGQNLDLPYRDYSRKENYNKSPHAMEVPAPKSRTRRKR